MALPQNSTSDHGRHLLSLLLIPSWISGALCIVISVALVSILTLKTMSSAGWLQPLFALQSSLGTSHAAPWAKLGDTTFSHSITTAVTFGFWFLVGIVVYLFIASIYNAIRQAKTFDHELQYVHVNRASLVGTAVVHFLMRAAAVLLWLGFARIFSTTILPYVASTLQSVSSHVGSATGIGILLLTTLLLAVCLHVLVILLRLLFLRPRLFRTTYV
ncbi:MAG TPA: hypothetical protein VLH84_02460 [Patescibacteria group bacterium]|nr:hypothetical protein [Patescibacteria group bacterium]